MDLLTENVPKSRLGCPKVRFCKDLGSSRVRLGWLLGALGRSWAGLGRFLAFSWALLGASWLPNAAQERPGLDFGGFRGRPGRISEAPRLYFERFFHAFRMRFVARRASLHNALIHAVATLFPCTCAFFSFLLVRRSVRSTWNNKFRLQKDGCDLQTKILASQVAVGIAKRPF